MKFHLICMHALSDKLCYEHYMVISHIYVESGNAFYFTLFAGDVQAARTTPQNSVHRAPPTGHMLHVSLPSNMASTAGVPDGQQDLQYNTESDELETGRLLRPFHVSRPVRSRDSGCHIARPLWEHL